MNLFQSCDTDSVYSTVLSFMSQFSGKDSSRHSPGPSSPTGHAQERFPSRQNTGNHNESPKSVPTTQQQVTAESRDQPAGRQRASSRPVSMVSAYQPPLMEVTQETLPELQPIFTFLNSHANKLYQEGYFLKLDDQNSRRYTQASSSYDCS